MNPAAQFDLLIQELASLRAALLDHEQLLEPELRKLSPSWRDSARNLIHYITLRRYDLRDLQHRLALLGLSSLGRAESNVMTTINAVIGLLSRAVGGGAALENEVGESITSEEASTLLQGRTDELLGPESHGRQVRIMVTMPSEAASNYDLIRDLVAGGMNCMRINCAHDGPREWMRMIEHLRKAEQETGRSCRVLMDMAGPKIRTGMVEPGPRVVKIRPRRDQLGTVIESALLLLVPVDDFDAVSGGHIPTLPVDAEFLRRLSSHDRVGLRDVRGAERFLTVLRPERNGWLAELSRTAYIGEGTLLTIVDGPGDVGAQGSVRGVPPLAGAIPLRRGEHLLLTVSPAPGRPAMLDERGAVLEPARIPCTLPELFEMVKPGEAIWFDDGKIGGIIRSVGEEGIDVEITQTGPTGSRLTADKGINVPDSNLRLSPLTEKDREDLRFIARHADIVGYSFVQNAIDVVELQERLAGLDRADIGIVLKVETRRAFEQLPNMLLAAMRSSSIGVMIARGDLAVECGYERLAEVQEEILWLCEAAHAPVIWATQVLERLTKEGAPSRPEITDAAMGERAECVMLNKGPYILDAVRVLDDILRRMQVHQHKKRAMLRRLKLADGDLQMR